MNLYLETYIEICSVLQFCKTCTNLKNMASGVTLLEGARGQGMAGWPID